MMREIFKDEIPAESFIKNGEVLKAAREPLSIELITLNLSHLHMSLIVAQLLFLESEAPDKDIILYINSPGGSITAGMGIYDTMNYIKCDVGTICFSRAASMAAFLLSSDTKGKRLSLPNAEIMIHQPKGQTPYSQVSDIEIHADRMKMMKESLTETLAYNCGKSYEELKRDTDRDNFMTAQQALEYGLIDGILEKRL